MRVPVWVRLHAPFAALAALAFLAIAPGSALAQVTTGRVTGVVTDSAGAPVGQADVLAISTSTGLRRTAQTDATGSYNLPALPPAQYRIEVRRIGYGPQARLATVGIGQLISIDFQLGTSIVQLEDIAIVSEPAVELRTSEAATNVSQQQIENLPTASRNFLDLAELAPGVRVSEDRANGTSKTFRSGALPAENINVFIDGASYKNDIINGGVAGQDASRGNPFPRNAIQEYRVITNNFKAEYQKASSAIITAVTKSGTNNWEGSAFFTLQNEALVALDSFSQAADTPGTQFQEPEFSRYLAGMSVGGPIVRDRLFFFGAWEGNFQNRDGVVRFGGDPAVWPADVAALEGETNNSAFRSNSFIGKLTYSLSERSLLELSGDWRHETDQRGFGGQFSGADRAFSAAENLKNDVATGRLKHTFLGSDWVNEAFVAYQRYGWNPEPVDFQTVGRQYADIGRIGGRDSRQDLAQKRLSLRDDITFTGFQWNGDHVFKTGLNVDFVDYRMNKELNENPLFFFDATNNYTTPVRAVFGFGEPLVEGSNTQFGIYAQDDWSPTPRLTVNLGVRYDVESGAYNLDYVTPQTVVDSILALNPSLFIPVDPDRYFTDGDDREAFKGAIQPRVGLSYALGELANTVIYGSAGIFYDRVPFNYFIDETYRRVHPNYTFFFDEDGVPDENNRIIWDDSFMSREGLEGIIASGDAPPQEIFLLPNDLKPPKSYQWSVGLRHDFGGWNAAVAYNGVRGRNGFTFEWANVDFNPDGTCCQNVPLPAYQNILVGNNEVRSWYDALVTSVDRPYRQNPETGFGWGAGISYTLSKAEHEGGDLFSFPNISVAPQQRREVNNDQPHRVVANFIVDIPYLFGIQFSGLAVFASGLLFTVTDNSVTPALEIGQDRGPMYKRVDLRFRKDFPAFMGGTRLGVIADIFNAFNFLNASGFNGTQILSDGSENPNFGVPCCLATDPRRLQLGLEYDF